MMMNAWTRKILTAAAVLGAAVCLQAAEKKAPVIYYDAIVAVVDGMPITGHQLREEIKSSNIMERYKDGDMDRNLSLAREEVLKQIIEQEILFREFKDLKAQIPGQMIQERLDQMVLQQADGNMERFEDILYESRMSVSELKKKIYKRLAAEMLLYDRVQRDIQISEPEIQEFYRKHSADFRKKGGYRLEEIQLKKDGRYAGRLQETWKKIRSELAAGKAFADAAREYSEDYLAAKGGDMGWQQELNEKLMKLVRSMKKGEISSEILRAGQAEYLIRLADRQEDGIRPLDEKLRTEILNRLRHEREQARYKEYMEPLMLKYGVKRY